MLEELGVSGGLEEARAPGLVAEVAPGTGAFRHTLVREAVYADIPSARRRTALELWPQGDEEARLDLLDRLAVCAERAGEVREAVRPWEAVVRELDSSDDVLRVAAANVDAAADRNRELLEAARSQTNDGHHYAPTLRWATAFFASQGNAEQVSACADTLRTWRPASGAPTRSPHRSGVR